MNVIRTDVITTYRQIDRDLTREKVTREREDRNKRVLGMSVNHAKRLGVDAEGVVRRGLPDKEIVNFAKGRDDMVLLLMGAFGKNFLEMQLVGSKTQEVLRKIPELDVPLAAVPCSINKQPV